MSKQTQSVYRTAKGTHIDMLKLINQNEMTVAVGNMKVNARGDKLGPGGKIIQQRDEVIQPAIQVSANNKSAQIESKAAPKGKKNVEDMDPEGNE
jgi:hypothetical protein